MKKYTKQLLNIASIFIVFFADVSKKFNPYLVANSFPSSVETCLSSSKSHLFPTKVIKTLFGEFNLQSSIQLITLSKDSLFDISYTTIAHTVFL